MSGSTRRIVAVGSVVVVGTLAVAGALAATMLLQHPIWLERSYRNRWAFRDVPTRRGSICDRDGRVLVQDQPRFALDLDYDAFRRGHPVGAAIAASALLWPGQLGHRRPEDAVDACMRLLDLPSAQLGAGSSSRDVARDLRFYVAMLVSELSGRPRRDVLRALLAVVEAGSDAAVADALHLERQALGEAMRVWSARLSELATLLRGDGAALDLGQVLDDQLERHCAGRPPVSRPLVRALPFEVASPIACQQEAWKGFLLRPAVTRAITPAVAALVSLPAVFGQVTAAGVHEGDGERIDELAHDLVADAQLEESLPDDVELSEQALARLTTRAQSYLRQRVTQGGRFGRSGVESAMEAVLAGLPGLRFVERDKRAREQLLYHSLDVNPGDDVRTTIDARLQEVLERVLDGHDGQETAMAVIDAATGDILALGGRPLQVADKDGKLFDRAVSPAASWPNAGYVGSLAKPFVLLEQLAAARAGGPHVPAGDFVRCELVYKRIGGRKIACDEVHGDEGRDPATALARSCNVFFFQVAEGIGMEGLRRAYARAGWVDVVSEDDEGPYQHSVPGLTKFSRPRLSPQGHLLQHVGIGYGVLANALSVARAYAGLATGRLPRLGLFAGERRPQVDLAIPAADLALVHEGLRGCVRYGTARGIEGLAGFGVHGKTGTAEVNERNENNAWFAGFVLAPNGRATLAFAAVAYTVQDHGKESARLVADFLSGLARHPDATDLHARWLAGEEAR